MLQVKDLKRPHFEAKDFWYSKTAEKNNISNVPPQSALTGLMKLADKLEFVRQTLIDKGHDIPMVLTSVFRCHQLNRLVKGSPNSAHLQGCAADLLFKGKTPAETCDLILQTGVVFDQMLIEENTLHFGIKIKEEQNRLEIAIAKWNPKIKKWVLDEPLIERSEFKFNFKTKKWENK
jgi:hypothetical protein